MKAFDYRAPTTVDEAVQLLAHNGVRARALAGGTDLLVQLRAGRFDLDLVVDVKRIPQLSEIRIDDEGGLTIGAAVPCYRVYSDPLAQKLYPGIVDSIKIIGGTGIQGRATIGGNLCNSSPSADSVPSLIVHNAIAQIAGPNGERQAPVESFATGPGRNILEKGEILVSVKIPSPPDGFGASYLRFIPRNEMDIAVVGVGSALWLGADGKIANARIALGAVGPTPIYAEEASQSLVGQEPTEEAFQKAGQIARQASRPIDDVRGSAAQRRHLVGVLTRRTLTRALERARA